MNYCSSCGAAVVLQVPPGDNRERHVCQSCQTIHYSNPKIVAGCILCWEERILLCRRAIEPRYGYWTLPAGFMENGETTMEAAAREALEEAHAQAEKMALYGIYNLKHISQVYVMFRGELGQGYARAGDESLEVRLATADEIPWPELAFPVVRETLERYLEERSSGEFRVHNADVLRQADGQLIIQRHGGHTTAWPDISR
ncbi:MAG: NUDIX hydrolase [Candidatus Competibacteraceae bacterium]|nr:NUDIX hydrolase [Candidatus Competibacteraceae bacterium]MCB1807376.1 NUDIX hydrolase [Candidatus Competibacteraceae bacterium]MCB1811658.1 NUDIX hydrolase [Candidatus Competibacteraceae bacterium]